jgi:hypothetical protein
MAAINKYSHIRTKVSINLWSKIVADHEAESNRILEDREKNVFDKKEIIIENQTHSFLYLLGFCWIRLHDLQRFLTTN